MKTKTLTPNAHATIQRLLAERDHYAFLAAALSQSIERVVEVDTGVNLTKEHWDLDLQNGCVVRQDERAG